MEANVGFLPLACNSYAKDKGILYCERIGDLHDDVD